MLDGPTVAAAARAAGFTHVVWVPDSHLGTWEEALLATPGLTLLRATREGEVIGLAAGLMLGGARPLAVVQCTGFFEAGDALRNVVHDLGLPLKMIVGVRSRRAHLEGRTGDNCPRLAEPVVRAWDVPFEWFDPFTQGAGELNETLGRLGNELGARILLWVE